MKITRISLQQLKVTEDVGSIEPAWNPGSRMAFRKGGQSVVEIHTDSGLVGIGPGIDPALLSGARTHLVGTSPFDIEQHARVLNYYARGPAYRGAAGLDMALWDLIGKAGNQPLSRLWGGGRARVPAYASMIQLSDPSERADLASRLVDEGWRAIKLRIHHDTIAEDLETVTQVRDAVGDRMAIMVDANQAQSTGTWQPGVLWDYNRALTTARELGEMGCYWFEEPLPRYAWDDYARLTDSVDVPIAGGENHVGLHEFRRMIEQNTFDILQPESMVLGGITNLRKVGTLAELFGKRVAPHHGGGDIGVIAHLHLVASWHHAPYLELLHDPPIGDYRHRFSIFTDPPLVGPDGCIPVPKGPGLGVTIDPDWIDHEIEG